MIYLFVISQKPQGSSRYLNSNSFAINYQYPILSIQTILRNVGVNIKRSQFHTSQNTQKTKIGNRFYLFTSPLINIIRYRSYKPTKLCPCDVYDIERRRTYRTNVWNFARDSVQRAEIGQTVDAIFVVRWEPFQIRQATFQRSEPHIPGNGNIKKDKAAARWHRKRCFLRQGKRVTRHT